MATEGNNSVKKFADFRDAFMTDEEKAYIKLIKQDMHPLSNNDEFELASSETIDGKKSMILNVANTIIDNMEGSDYYKQLLKSDVAELWFYSKFGPKGIVSFSERTKMILVQALSQCVEMEVFTEEEMEYVENTMCWILNGLEDIHMVNIREKYNPDDSRER